MSSGNGEPLLGTNLSQLAMPQAAQSGMTSAPQAGGNPMAVANAPTYGGTSTAPMPGAMPVGGNGTATTNPANNGTSSGNPYSSFLNALQQIQSASPVNSIGQTVPNATRSQASQQATMRETGVG